MSAKKRVIYPIALPPDLEAKLAEAVRKTGLPKSEVMRLAMAIGIENLRAVNYDLAAVVTDAARRERGRYRADDSPAALRVADEPEKEDGNGTSGK